MWEEEFEDLFVKHICIYHSKNGAEISGFHSLLAALQTEGFTLLAKDIKCHTCGTPISKICQSCQKDWES